MKAIHVFSIMHTGTHFILRTLECHPDWNKTIYEIDLFTKDNSGPGFNLYHHHHHPYRDWPYLDVNVVGGIQTSSPIVIPLRDPIKSLLSMSTRNGPQPLESMINGFIYLAKMDSDPRYDYFDIMFVPIDLGLDLVQRKEIKRRLFDHCQLTYEPKATLDTIAKNWMVQNKLQDHKYKTAYIDGDIDYATQDIQSDIIYLKKNISTLQPFFEKYGYTNLPWFD